MRHVTLTTLAVATAVVAIVACEEQAPERGLTAPDAVSFAKPVAGCDAKVARTITTQQAALWVKPALDSAAARFALITDCTGAAGKSAMLSYIQWTIDNRLVNRKTGATDAMLLTHWNTVFPYVGYVGNDQPSSVPTTIFTVDGAAKVIKGNAEGELTAANAALTSYPQDSDGDPRDHLFVIYPINPNCLTGTNLQQSGPCYEFSAFPHVSPKFSPKVKVGICQPLHEGENSPLARPSLGHLDPITKVTEDAGTYPTFCEHLADATPAGSWHNGFGDAVKRLAWYAKKAVSPEPLYAVHGGLGGLGGGLSPFGAVDREVFRATFETNTVGQQPGAPETGTWSIVTLTPPGSIVVQSSLGQQNSKLVVLNQSGGNCKNCGGLYLRGNLESAGPAAKDGIYEAEFDALQAQSNMKEAVFALRDTADANIATVTFAVRNNTKLIIYNDGNGQPKVLGNWVQYVPAHFRIQVNLDTKKTTIWFNNATDPAYSDLAFTGNAKNLARIVADFRGIDSGTMGWDNVVVSRLSDVGN